MFTTGSKFLVGATVIAVAAATFYGLAVGGALGTITLTTGAFGLAVLTGINLFVRDSNISALDHDAFPSAPAAQTSARSSYWPLLAALGATVAAVGLVTSSAVFVVGMGFLVAAGFEWAIQGWSERASDSARFNADAREQFADPLELPVGGAIVGAIIVFMFSRVMLGLPDKTSTVVAFTVVAALVLIVGVLIGTNRKVAKPAMAGSFALGLVAVTVAGSVFGLNGTRDIEVHETASDLAVEDHCVAEETHADKNASQTVGAKSSIAGEVIYDGSTLVANIPGLEGQFKTMTLLRANPNNVIFRNESNQPARLVIDLYPAEDTEYPARVCSTLTEPGGAAFLTVIPTRSARIIEAETGENFAFVVPGTDTSLEVNVP